MASVTSSTVASAFTVCMTVRGVMTSWTKMSLGRSRLWMMASSSSFKHLALPQIG